jgi:hypothetical protein
MAMAEHLKIENRTDAELFLARVNGLHDGHIISAEYKNDGIEIVKGGYEFHPEKTELKLSVLVTSIGDTIVEMIFDEVSEWRIQSGYCDDILDSHISFDINGFVIWSDDQSEYSDIRVVAKNMRWRIIEI